MAAALFVFSAASGAQVIRCVDAQGHVSYGDTACPPGARQAERKRELEVGDGGGGSGRAEGAAEAGDARHGAGDAAGAGAGRVGSSPLPPSLQEQPQPQQQPGLIVLDPRGDDDAARVREAEWERLRREDEERAAMGGGLYDPAYPGVYHRPPRPRDMRPRLRDCDAAGCRDAQGNHYDRSGRLDRYVRPDGRTCRPVGTTVVCN